MKASGAFKSCSSVCLCMHVCLIDQCSLPAGQSNILGAGHVYSAPEWRLLSAPVTLHVLIHMHLDTVSHRHTHARAHKEPLSNSLLHTPTPSPSGPVEGHAFVSRCQDAGVCSCASRSIRFILSSRGCPFVCGPVSFQPTPISASQEDTGVSVVVQGRE